MVSTVCKLCISWGLDSPLIQVDAILIDRMCLLHSLDIVKVYIESRVLLLKWSSVLLSDSAIRAWENHSASWRLVHLPRLPSTWAKPGMNGKLVLFGYSLLNDPSWTYEALFLICKWRGCNYNTILILSQILKLKFACSDFKCLGVWDSGAGSLPVTLTVLGASVLVGITTSLILFCSHFHQVSTIL